MRKEFFIRSLVHEGIFRYRPSEEDDFGKISWKVSFTPNSGYKRYQHDEGFVETKAKEKQSNIHGLHMLSKDPNPSRKLKIAISGVHTIFDVELVRYELTGAIPLTHWKATNLHSGQVLNIQIPDNCTRFDLSSVLAKSYDGRTAQ